MMAASLIALGITQINNRDANNVLNVLSILFLAMYIISFQLSLGPLLWIYMSEIMTEKGLSIGAFLNQIVQINIAFFTQPLIDAFGGKS